MWLFNCSNILCSSVTPPIGFVLVIWLTCVINKTPIIAHIAAKIETHEPVTPPHNNVIKISKHAISDSKKDRPTPTVSQLDCASGVEGAWFNVCQWGLFIMPPVSVSSGLQQTTHCTPQHSDSLRPSGGSTCGPFRPRGPANHNTTQSAHSVMWDGPISAFTASYSTCFHIFLSFPHWPKCKPAHLKTTLIPRASTSKQISVCDTCRAIVLGSFDGVPPSTWLVQVYYCFEFLKDHSTFFGNWLILHLP